MNIEFLRDTIDFTNRDFSLVLVCPKANLLEWLDAFVKLRGLDAYRLYGPEENTVLIIPSIERFSEPGSLEQFLDEMKPKLLLGELTRFQSPTPEEFGHPITKETFDMFFEMDLRDSPSIHFLSDFDCV